ncbi:MAG: hypothetical protein AAF404_10860 [Pseudomonadota bacterium]
MYQTLLVFSVLMRFIVTHSCIKIRYSKFIDQWLYPKMKGFIYGDRTYITDDEERLTERDVKQLLGMLGKVETRKYFNAFVTRVVPDRFTTLSQLDQLLLRWLPFAATLLGSRLLIAARVK